MTITVILRRLEDKNDIQNTHCYREALNTPKTPIKIPAVYIRDTDLKALGHPEYIQMTLSAVDDDYAKE